MSSLSSLSISAWQTATATYSKQELIALLSNALSVRTFLVGYSLSAADISMYKVLHDSRIEASAFSVHNTRWFALCDALVPENDNSNSIERRIAALEVLAFSLPSNFDISSFGSHGGDGVKRVADALKGFAGSVLWRVPSDYYTHSLAARAETLKSPISALCKTLIFNVTSLLRTYRVAVLLQYISKLDVGALEKKLGGGAVVHLAVDGAQVTGFEHNGVAPLGSLISIPLIVTNSVFNEPFIWCGGGASDVKARIFHSALKKIAMKGVWDISTVRSDYDDSTD